MGSSWQWSITDAESAAPGRESERHRDHGDVGPHAAKVGCERGRGIADVRVTGDGGPDRTQRSSLKLCTANSPVAAPYAAPTTPYCTKRQPDAPVIVATMTATHGTQTTSVASTRAVVLLL